MLRLLAIATVCVCVGPVAAHGQQTRAEWLEQQRAERARALSPHTPNVLERGLLFAEQRRIFERFGKQLRGWYPRIGGFTTGSGPTLGVGLRQAVPGTTDVEADISGAISARGYKALDLRVRTPALLGGQLRLEGGTRWWDYTQEDFFGLGESAAGNRADYRYLGVTVHTTAHLSVRPWLSVGEEIGYLRPEIRDGTDREFPSIRDRFTDADAPGLNRQPRLLYTRGFIDLDYRDEPGNTRAGGRVWLQFGTGRDQDPSREFSYRRTDLDIQHVFPILGKKRNLAFRVAAAHVDPLTPGGRIPFFLSPTIGGSHTIRSFRELRFRDATYVLVNTEYRWEAFSGLDMALFWDGGDVGTTIEQIRANEFKTGWGLGLRFNTNRRIFLRVDAGFGGPEGPRIFWKYSPAF